MARRVVLAFAVLAAPAVLFLACTGDDPVPSSAVPTAGEGGSTAPVSTTPASPLACEGGASRCGAVCTDLGGDPSHCGRCGRACGGSSRCVEGQCQAQVLANNVADVHQVMVAGEYLYFASASFGKPSLVGRLLKDGSGPVEPIATTEKAPQFIDVHAGRAYWTTWDDGAIRTASVAAGVGGQVATVLSDPGASTSGAFDLHVDDTGILWASVINGVFALPPYGTTDAGPTEIVRARASVLSVENDWVYFTVQGNAAGARRAQRDGGSADGGVVLIDGMASAFGLTTDATYLYVTDSGNGTLKRVPKAGGDVVVLTTDLKSPRGIVVDAEYAYVSEFVVGGSIVRVPIEPGDSGRGDRIYMASNLALPNMIAQDEDFLYWGNMADGRIMRVRK